MIGKYRLTVWDSLCTRGIIDIYPLTEEVPIRIEFWDDEIDSIRTFDLESQRSIENLEEVVIYPATDFRKKREKEFLF